MQIVEPMTELEWTQGKGAPDVLSSLSDTAVTHGNTAFFSICQDIYSYTAPENKWTKLKSCKYSKFGMVIINDNLTTVGGLHERLVVRSTPTNMILSLCGNESWEELIPPMPTKRTLPACVTTPTHLLVAGGKGSSSELSTVEMLDIKTLQWSTAQSLPQIIGYPLIAVLDNCVYISSNHKNTVFSSSVEELTKSCKHSTSSSGAASSSECVWTRLADIPVQCGSSLATLKGRVLAIGGAENVYGDYITAAIHCYDAATDMWCVAGEMPSPRYRVLAATLTNNNLVIVGGCKIRYNTPSVLTEVATVLKWQLK